ncbi:glycoside hydrolase family 19 protein [Burkholderia ambifaria]|jgi:putative chitinase|uniref:glycoside hydrolase family 19 protein n=1 Tax=Burkholderia ambifaria TaxID=152480 RepID=UPI00158F2964|nr:glycoside hydrolase family 19 protein [Burkholderia ambifaria]
MDKNAFQRAAQLTPALADRWYAPVTAAMAEFGVDTPARQAMFIAQVAHESGGFAQLVESFNYRPDALALFSRVPAHMRAQLGRHPGESVVPVARQHQIANLAYGDRYGNGPAESGDGWRYRGRGLKHVTFRANYEEAGRALGVDLVLNPDLLATNDVLAARSAAWFWKAHNLNACADRGDCVGATKIINGGLNGQPQREARWKVAKQVLGVA